MSYSEFSESGFAYTDGVVLNHQLLTIEKRLSEIDGVGSRRMLDQKWVCDLARDLMNNETLKQFFDNKIAVQCTFLDKSPENNWLVPTHQDRFIPVARTIDSEKWTGWSEKEEIQFVAPPDDVLEKCIALRLHIDDSTTANGMMEVFPGSHISNQRQRSIAIQAEAGSVLLFRPLLFRPLLFHRSSKAVRGRRRVLQFLFGPVDLPDGAEWFYKIYRNVF